MIIGIDISKQTFDVSWVEDDREHHRQYDYTENGIASFQQAMPEDSFYVMEGTGLYHVRLALSLHAAGEKLSVVNPLVIKRYAQMQLTRVKSDKADAGLIRRYGEAHELQPWAPSSAEVLELQQAHSWLNDLLNERTRLTNRQEAHAQWVAPSKFVRKQMKTQKKRLDEEIKACEKHLERHVKKSFADLYERLLSIPSIGPKTALELIIVTDGFRRFSDVKALSAYVGVSPTTHTSGTSVKGRGTIAKMGAGRMRQLLYLCSWTAKRCNGSCRALATRMKAMGKPRKVINIAVAHKLLRQAFAVAMNNVPYSENYA